MRKFSRLVSRDKTDKSEKQDTSRSKSGDRSGPGLSAWISSALLHTPKRGVDQERLTALIDNVKDYQLGHGSLIKLVPTEEEATILARPIGATLYPLRYPKASFDQATHLQTVYNQLYAAVATDVEWLGEALRPLLTPNSFASKLWSIHTQVQEEGYVQEFALGIFRSDYILHANPHRPQDPVVPKQVEFNTFSCAGIAHSSRISAMHRHLARSGSLERFEPHITLQQLPKNNSVDQVIGGLSEAHAEYNRQRGTSPSTTGILIVVQPFNVNIADERPFEYGLWDNDIPAYHIVWGLELLRCTTLTQTRELLFHPPGCKPDTAVEIAVVYHRAGYDEEEYSDAAGMECRLRIERSRAIKCPSVLSHLSGFKMVQQALSSPGALLRFLSPDKASRVVDTFAPMYPLDSESPRGRRGRELASNPETADNHVLKPSLEGGGHNVYRREIPKYLSSLLEKQWEAYILMERIHPPESNHILIGPRGLYYGPVESELGIVGTCLWANHAIGDTSPGKNMLLNNQAGFTLKTKAKGIDEMSVIKGYGCFDSPLLV